MKNNFHKILILSFSFFVMAVFMSTTCEKEMPVFGYGDIVTLCNHSDETIYWSGLDFDGGDNEDMTVLQALKESSLGLLKLLPKEEIRTHFVGSIHLENPYQLMIFRQSTLDKYGFDQLIDMNLYDKLFKLDREELVGEKRSIIVFED